MPYMGEADLTRLRSLSAGLRVPAPDQTGLLLRGEPQLFIEPWTSGAEPEQFHMVKAGMVQNALDELRADTLLLIRMIDDHVPNGRAVDEIREHTTEPNQAITVPGAEYYVTMAQHFRSIFHRPIFGPRGLMKETKELRHIQIGRFGKC